MRYTVSRINIIRALNTILKGIYSNIYFERVPQGTSLPYAVYNVGLITQREGGSSRSTIEIDIWDNKGSNIIALEEIAEDITEGIYKQICDFGEFSLRFEDATINSIPDPDENIRRRNISVDVIYYNK